jgi:hypothetical protein
MSPGTLDIEAAPSRRGSREDDLAAGCLVVELADGAVVDRTLRALSTVDRPTQLPASTPTRSRAATNATTIDRFLARPSHALAFARHV